MYHLELEGFKYSDIYTCNVLYLHGLSEKEVNLEIVASELKDPI